ncbi:MAG: hypothetical protein KC636_38495, partial [Myxococcales bacterium]|nr:hypothetical protein [Myxococcales bacterium]
MLHQSLHPGNKRSSARRDGLPRAGAAWSNTCNLGGGMAPRLSRLLPIARWLPAYRRADAPRDLVAGVTTAVMLIPQGMAYAMLAGLPPIVGLYASTLPLVAYALVGTSRQLAIGPVAIDSLLVAAAVGSLASVGSDAYLAHAIALAAMVGIIEVTLGALRAGFLVNFLAQPVVSGFTSAAALVIGLSQAPNLLGVTLPRGQPFHAQLAALAGALPQSHAPTLLVGLAAIVLLLLARRLGPRVPGALLVVAITTLAVWGLDLDAAGVAIVGVVPAGLPPLALPTFELDALGSLLPTALTIAFVGYMEAISVARAFARKHRYEIDANQELLGLGLANAAASVCGGYPITGGFSRTAVNAQAGARTPLAGIITAAVIVAALLLLTPLLYYVPKATLAAIIVVAVAGLV